MSQGFAIYDASGQIILDSNSIAWVSLGRIVVNYPAGGSQSYPDLHEGAEIVTTVQPIDPDIFTGSLGSGGEYRSGRLDTYISNGAKTVSWNWVDPTGLGYNYTQAILAVFAR